MTPRDTLRAIWDALATRGATVRRVDLDGLPDELVDGLLTEASKRYRAIVEGEKAGWRPQTRGAA